MIDSGQLERMQATVERSFNSTCLRHRYAVELDRFNNPVRSGASIDVGYPCRFVPAPGSEETVDRQVQTHEGSFLLPHEADVLAFDVLEVAGVSWEVLGPATTQSWTTHLRVLVRRSETS